ncbi:MAG: RnfH family protein [Salinicola sp.]|nr:RnfH family protein [uncultured Salinicola sp.]MAM57198.1 RnfH family protein [Salinicola sp.]|tara:strand:- start:917 stop:1219 length:303 start_codon:yes stop_codon:yes gene_type:complete
MPMESIEVAFATPEHQTIVRLTLEPGIDARRAVMLADLPSRHPAWRGFDFTQAPLGIFGQRLPSPEEYQPVAGDRIEVYRPLELDPKQARRERAANASTR